MSKIIKITTNTQDEITKGLAIFEYNGEPIEFSVINGSVFANATKMCQAFNKDPHEWQRKKTTIRYINALLKNQTTGKSRSLIETREGVNGGTWIHEKLIIKLAAWLDVDFEIWCDEKIAELLRTGEVRLKSIAYPLALPPRQLTYLLHAPEKIEIDYRTPIYELHRYYRKPQPGEPCEYFNIYEMMDFTRAFSGKKISQRQLKKEIENMEFEEGCTEINGRPHWGYMVVITFATNGSN